MMYEELVQNLRICSNCDFGQDCNVCTQRSDNDRFCCDKLLHDAADAIEELLASCKNFEDALKDLVEETTWIPVTERLPNDHERVLVVNDDGKMLTAERAQDDWWICYCVYDVDRWWTGENGVIKAWMPLPEPPKDADKKEVEK